jgi:3-methyladenine DNA glycosylase AlkD
MDDLQAVARALVDNGPKSFNLTHLSDTECRIYAADLRATFRRDESGVWHLDKSWWDRCPETITGLLASIEEA